jgi:hypothetical protein
MTDDFERLLALVEEHIEPYLLSHPQISASDYLRQKIADSNIQLIIEDHATGGNLQSKLLHPDTYSLLRFDKVENHPNDSCKVVIHGLKELWQNQDESNDAYLAITLHKPGQELTIERTIPYRHMRIISYAVEFICDQMLKFYEI